MRQRARTHGGHPPSSSTYVGGPVIDQLTQDVIANAFKGVKGVMYKPNRSFTRDIETPDALVEPDDMTIVAPPCHPNEPVKVPESDTARVYCLVCGDAFSA